MNTDAGPTTQSAYKYGEIAKDLYFKKFYNILKGSVSLPNDLLYDNQDKITSYIIYGVDSMPNSFIDFA